MLNEINEINNTNITDIMNTTDITNYIFTTGNMCRLFFYTPIIFCVSVIGSVAYDYLTYKEKEDNSKKSE